MAKALKVVGTIAGAVATVASFIPGAQPIAAAAAAVAAVANVGSALLTKKPPAKGAVNNVLIQADAPMPIALGRCFNAGVLRHDTAWGGKVNKVQNPYRAMVLVYSGCGPVQSMGPLMFDYQPVGFSGSAATGYYSGFLWEVTQLGQMPETSALASLAAWGTMPGWDSSSKLSGKAAALINLKFDKDGKVFAAGVPPMGRVVEGVRAWDPRLDSTWPGGSGTHRAGDATTWAYTRNPGILALAYARGWFAPNGLKVGGVGLPLAGIDVAEFIAFANVCDANGWHCDGTIFEPPGTSGRRANLDDILAAGGGRIGWRGAKLSVTYRAPRIAIGTVEHDDLSDGQVTWQAMVPIRERKNGLVPKFRSEAHNWDYTAGDLIEVGAFVTADGEERQEEVQYNLVTDGDQAAQLAAYDLWDMRERRITIPLKPHMRAYRVGHMLTINLPRASRDLDGVDAVMVERSLSAGGKAIIATFETYSPDKDAAALAASTTLPPTPTVTTGEDRDGAASDNLGVIAGVAIVPPAGSLAVTTQSGSSAALQFTLADGESRSLTASIKVDGLTGTCTQTIAIEWREAGGSWATLGSAVSDSGSTGDTVAPTASEVLTNSSGVTKLFEARAATSKTGPGTGTIDASQSYISA